MKQVFFLASILLSMTARAQFTNYHFCHTDSTGASSDKIWELWTDVPNWKLWDKGLKSASLEGDFVVGAKGVLLPDKGPKSTFVVTELLPNQSYTFQTKIPLGWLIIQRTLEQKQGRTYFTHEVEFTGPFKKILGKRLGKRYRSMLPEVMGEIKRIAESR